MYNIHLYMYMYVLALPLCVKHTYAYKQAIYM